MADVIARAKALLASSKAPSDFLEAQWSWRECMASLVEEYKLERAAVDEMVNEAEGNADMEAADAAEVVRLQAELETLGKNTALTKELRVENEELRAERDSLRELLNETFEFVNDASGEYAAVLAGRIVLALSGGV